MDVSSLDTSRVADSGFTFKLTHPDTGAELDIEFTVLGSDSDTYRDKNNEIIRFHQRAMEKRGKYKLLTPDEEEAGKIEVLVACTVGWKNLQVGGKDFPFSIPAARELYKMRGLKWIRNQVYAAVHEVSNFLPKAANS